MELQKTEKSFCPGGWWPSVGVSPHTGEQNVGEKRGVWLQLRYLASKKCREVDYPGKQHRQSLPQHCRHAGPSDCCGSCPVRYG